ncbi:hypothetical protein FOA52_013730 [Chlamydomonas sp. UWO 241]|nr:hypothetical protein FOA52_013730 [Chlamydomonas sp. UWO 241]
MEELVPTGAGHDRFFQILLAEAVQATVCNRLKDRATPLTSAAARVTEDPPDEPPPRCRDTLPSLKSIEATRMLVQDFDRRANAAELQFQKTWGGSAPPLTGHYAGATCAGARRQHHAALTGRYAGSWLYVVDGDAAAVAAVAADAPPGHHSAPLPAPAPRPLARTASWAGPGGEHARGATAATAASSPVAAGRSLRRASSSAQPRAAAGATPAGLRAAVAPVTAGLALHARAAAPLTHGGGAWTPQGRQGEQQQQQQQQQQKHAEEGKGCESERQPSARASVPAELQLPQLLPPLGGALTRSPTPPANSSSGGLATRLWAL